MENLLSAAGDGTTTEEFWNHLEPLKSRSFPLSRANAQAFVVPNLPSQPSQAGEEYVVLSGLYCLFGVQITACFLPVDLFWSWQITALRGLETQTRGSHCRSP